jgi:hypothetical protein
VYWYVYLLGFGLALLVVWLHAERVATHPALGGYLDPAALTSWPEFRSDGRVRIYDVVKGDVASLYRYLLTANFTPLGKSSAYALLMLAGLSSLFHRRTLGKFGWWLLVIAVVATVWYFIARQFFPLLFLPDRYLVYPWRLWAPMVLTLVAAGIWRFQPKSWLAGLLAVGLLGYGYYRQPPENLPTTSQEGRELLFAALSALPEAALIALPPTLADQVPVFTHRNVFISHESAHALYFKNYHDYIMPRFHDFVTAYTTTGDSLGNVVDFMDKWQIDYFLVDRHQLKSNWLRTFEPHQGYFRERIEGTTREERTLLNLPDSVGVLIQERLHLVSRGELEKLADAKDPAGVDPD